MKSSNHASLVFLDICLFLSFKCCWWEKKKKEWKCHWSNLLNLGIYKQSEKAQELHDSDTNLPRFPKHSVSFWPEISFYCQKCGRKKPFFHVPRPQPNTLFIQIVISSYFQSIFLVTSSLLSFKQFSYHKNGKDRVFLYDDHWLSFTFTLTR